MVPASWRVVRGEKLEERSGNATRRGPSMRSLLLIMLIVGFGVGRAVFTLGNTFAAVTGLARSTSQQSTSTSTTTSTTHNCTRTSGLRIRNQVFCDPPLFLYLVTSLTRSVFPGCKKSGYCL